MTELWQYSAGGAGGKGVWGKPGLELEETGACDDVHDPNYDSDSQVNHVNIWLYKSRLTPKECRTVLIWSEAVQAM